MGMLSMPVPPGSMVLEPSVKKLKESRVIENYSISSGVLTLYFKEFKAGSRQLLSIELLAQYPGTILSQPVRIYPYYQPENFAESLPDKLKIARKAEE